MLYLCEERMTPFWGSSSQISGANMSTFTLLPACHGSSRDIDHGANLIAATKVLDVVKFINEPSNALDLEVGRWDGVDRGVNDQVFDLLCLRKKLSAMEGVMEKLRPNGAFLEHQAIIEWIDLLQGISRQLMNEFNDISRSINGIKFTIKKVTLTLE